MRQNSHTALIFKKPAIDINSSIFNVSGLSIAWYEIQQLLLKAIDVVVSKSIAKEWGVFIVKCEREGRPILLLDDYIEEGYA